MDGNAKLRVKVGDAEFDAEGPPDLIKEQYQAFLEAVRASPAPTPAQPAALMQPAPQPGTAGTASNGVSTPPADQMLSAMLKRVFRDAGPVISLLALPKSKNAEADALLLLLYGYQELRKGEYPVTGVRLMQAAKQSGLHQIKRADRTISMNEPYIMAAGAHRGRKYSLNNQGVTRAEEIIREIIG